MKLRNKKTGEIIETCKIIQNAFGEIIMLTLAEDERFPYEYHSIAELNEEWEDYAPKEPRIDNKEIREIIRAWADVNDAGKLKYNYDENSLEDIYRNTITFNRGLGLEDGCSYTIPELCGEEEE